jgi:LacI family transcriptional regulator
MSATLRDVAEAAGVSIMAVSKVLHGRGATVRVGAQTAERIRKVASELRYQPNHIARSLRSRQTQTVGVVLQHFDRLTEQNPYYPQVFNGLMGALFPAGYTLAICPKLVQRSDEGVISDGRFDGILWCRPDFTEDSVQGLRHSRIPVVMMHAPPGSASGIPTFCANNDGALRLVVQHLAELGHRRIGFVIDPVNAPTAEGRDRAAAFQTAISAAGLEGEVLIWEYDSPELAHYRKGKAPYTALAAFSDFHAGQLLEACQRFGIRVPEDLSIVGFDSNSFCETTSPRLTSVSQPVERIAFEATSHLLSLIEAGAEGAGEDPPRSFIYDCGLDVRDSTARPRAS